MLDAKELHEKYKNRNLMEELSWGYGCIYNGYLRQADAEFLRWVCSESYDRIKSLENEKSKWIDEINQFLNPDIDNELALERIREIVYKYAGMEGDQQ